MAASSWCSRVLLVALSVFALFHAVDSFMCYTREMGDDSQSVTFCSTFTCFSVGASVWDNEAVQKGCAEEPHEEGCIASGIAGFASAHKCYCKSPLCNAGYTPSIVLPLLLLPALVQYLI